MPTGFHTRVSAELADIDAQGLTKPERIIQSRQGPVIEVGGRHVLNFCANNYLGLAGDQRIVDAANAASDRRGGGTASVRFICGTLDIHKELERSIADYLGFEDAILFAAAFDANGGLFEPLFGADDAIISDSLTTLRSSTGFACARQTLSLRQLRHGRAGDPAEGGAGRRRPRYRHRHRRRVSMDGYIARLADIRALADKYDALIMVDDCHATGFLGTQGKGSFAHHGVTVDFVTGTFGKALGGAMGGFICATSAVVQLLKQRARPYLFSNALAPSICGASLEAIRIAQGSGARRCAPS